jgi:hypothetical protein
MARDDYCLKTKKHNRFLCLWYRKDYGKNMI